MTVDIYDLVKENIASIELDFSEILTDIEEMSHDYKIDKPVNFKGTLSNSNGTLILHGKLEAEYETLCSRCTAPVNGSLSIDLFEEIFDAGTNTEEDNYTHDGKLLDIDKIIKDNIILKLPMIQLCSVSCKGLCPMCGCDLNIEQCNCREQDINPHFEKLNGLFNNLNLEDENKKD